MVDSADSVYMNTSEPFCVVTMGIQGGGKSHTVCTILEICLLSFPVPSADPLVVLKEPLSGLVLHYDQSETNVCEATGTCRLNPELEAILSYRDSVYSESIGTLSQMVILVSPTFYHQRKKFYGTADNKYKVLPLLFRWAALNAVQLKKLMRINESDNQLYVGVMLAKLREYQRAGGVPEFRTERLWKHAALRVSQDRWNKDFKCCDSLWQRQRRMINSEQNRKIWMSLLPEGRSLLQI